MLAWCDSPLSITGFGVVAKNILGRIYKTGMFDLACVGINHFEEHFDKAFEDRTEVPYKVFIGQDVARQGNQTVTFDPMGRAKTIQMLKQGNIDVFFCMRDLWDMVYQNAQGRPHLESFLPLNVQLAKEAGANFRVLSHFPLEYQVQPGWTPAIDMMDYGYCFTAGGMPQMEPYADKIAWCPQGCDTNIFKPLKNFNKDAFKQARMRLDPDTFVVLCVQRNQPRKDIPATIEAFAKFKALVGTVEGKRPVLWLHMRPDDQFGDARKWVNDNGLQVDHDVCFPPNFNVGAGWSEAELNMLYNTADVFISTSVAEGFGLTPVEAGCAGIPVLVPGHTGHLQTISQLGMPYVACKPMEKREKVAPSPVTPTNTDDMAQKLADHYGDPTKLNGLVRKNLKQFRKTFSWDKIFNEYWMPVLETIQDDIFGTEARQKKNEKRFLFVCEEAAGDIAAGAAPAIAALKRKYPNTPIDFMCKEKFRQILMGMPEIDTQVPWDINKIFDYPRDRVFYPHAKIRHGNWSSGWSHLMDMQSEMIGLFPEGSGYCATKEFDLKLDDMDGSVPDLITIHTTSQGGKMIGADKWSELIKGILSKNPDMRFAIIGGKDDMMVPGALDFRGLPFEEQAWLQKISFCHIGIDSSPMHFAQIVGQPSITFWGWTNPEVCKARAGGVHIVAHHPTVCPKFGPCHGVQPACGINQYDTKSAMSAPCARSLDVGPAVQIVNKALSMGIEDGRKWLWDNASKEGNIYGIPTLTQAEDKKPAPAGGKLALVGAE